MSLRVPFLPVCHVSNHLFVARHFLGRKNPTFRPPPSPPSCRLARHSHCKVCITWNRRTRPTTSATWLGVDDVMWQRPNGQRIHGMKGEIYQPYFADIGLGNNSWIICGHQRNICMNIYIYNIVPRSVYIYIYWIVGYIDLRHAIHSPYQCVSYLP